MSNRIDDIGLYVIITDPVLSYGEIAEICVEEGIGMLQLRQKCLTDRELVCVGREIKSVTNGSKTLFCINDRADIAVATDADVLHLGQDDMSIEDARKIVGQDMIIGLSTHTLDQAHVALSKQPDYIGYGPIFPTTTKVKADTPVGMEQLKEVLGFSTVPVVALGGLFPSNLEMVRKAGASSYSLVRYLMETDHLRDRIRECRAFFK